MTDLFLEASRDVEAEHLSLRLAEAKVAVAHLWPFLALAQSPDEFTHRLALTHDRIAAQVPEDLMQVTVTALKDDFAELHTYRQQELARMAAATPPPPPEPVRPGQQIWHHARQEWVTVTAGQESGLPNQPMTRHNDLGNSEYFDGAAEEGPNTGSDGGFAQFPAGPDPVDPLNSMFPAQPQPWTVPPNAGWVERPMQLTPGAGKQGSRPGSGTLDFGCSLAQSAVRSVLASAGYVDEGVQTGPGPNPDYFGGGSEGVGGDPQAGYPEDLAVQDPDNRANEVYGAVPPQQSSGSGQGGAQPYSNPGVAHQSSVRHTAPGGGEHAPYKLVEGDGGWYVVNAKGERKNSEPKSKEDARQFQKALYRNVPGAAESAQKAASFHDPRDPGVRVIAQDGMPESMGTTAPPPPPSMIPGGVGSVAQEPMAPGVTSTGNPVTDPGGADAAARQLVASIARTAADNIRQRPTDFNPSGVADEFDDNTWEGQANTRPRQPSQDRNVNTPQTSRDPIPQISSSDFQRELSEDENRLVQGFARRAVREWAVAR